MGLGQDGLDKKKMEICIKDMSSITGQHPVITKFKNQFQILNLERDQTQV